MGNAGSRQETECGVEAVREMPDMGRLSTPMHSPRMGRPTGTSPTLSGDGDFCMDVSWWRGPFPIDAEPGRHAAAGFELLYALLRSEQANTPAQLTCVRRTAQSAAVRDIFPHGEVQSCESILSAVAELSHHTHHRPMAVAEALRRNADTASRQSALSSGGGAGRWVEWGHCQPAERAVKWRRCREMGRAPLLAMERLSTPTANTSKQ
eukprot:jgi/Tetstr1/463476/TSEL_008367.t2